MNNERLHQQFEFIVEIDKMKSIYRQSMLTDCSRNENDAEHSWHLAMMAMLLVEHTNEKNIDIYRVMKMVLIHDIVEIDAGDTFAYDEKGQEDKEQREQEAAERLFYILPKDQAEEIHMLWREFEGRETPEARFATAIDRLQPMLQNYFTQGASWQKHNVKKAQVIARNQHIAEGSEALWAFAKWLIEDAVEKGYLAP